MNPSSLALAARGKDAATKRTTNAINNRSAEYISIGDLYVLFFSQSGFIIVNAHFYLEKIDLMGKSFPVLRFYQWFYRLPPNRVHSWFPAIHHFLKSAQVVSKLESLKGLTLPCSFGKSFELRKGVLNLFVRIPSPFADAAAIFPGISALHSNT